MPRSYGRAVAYIASVLIGVATVIFALSLAAIGVLALIHSLHHTHQPPVVTVTTNR